MDEYKEWLERKISEMNELAESNAKARLYSAANTYVTQMNVYKECLFTLEHFNKQGKQDKKLNFNDLEVGKKYISVFENSVLSDIFVIFSKGCDDKGNYIWRYSVSNVDIACKSYEQEYSEVKYFKEVI